jgi:AraC-like DNA-binding protein/ligand-binding sensor protein
MFLPMSAQQTTLSQIPPHKSFQNTIFERLLSSERFTIYQDAFRAATGLPLRLVESDTEKWCLDDQSINRSPFCEKLNLCKSACHACIDVNKRLMEEADVSGPATCHCFAGLYASAVPIKLGASTIAYLKTGQVFSRSPDENAFRDVLAVLGKKTIPQKEVDLLHDAYFQTRAVEPQRYQSMITLLASFAEQLSHYTEQLAIIDQGSEPAAIAKAKKYIHENLDQALPLGEVARVAGLSESHFCRLFKDATDLTLTDYINRCRIEWAKRELLRPEVRVSEIAYQIGYQSLSQFNRSFARITGTSPTNYRRDQLSRAAS